MSTETGFSFFKYPDISGRVFIILNYSVIASIPQVIVAYIDTAYFFKLHKEQNGCLVVRWSWKSNLKSNQATWLKADQESTNLRL